MQEVYANVLVWYLCFHSQAHHCYSDFFQVLADGSVLDCLSTLRKDNTGRN